MVGIEGGKLEHWKVDTQGEVTQVYDAHPEAMGDDTGISVIVELKSKSQLLRGKPEEDDGFRILATASPGSNIIKLWKVDKNLQISYYN